MFGAARRAEADHLRYRQDDNAHGSDYRRSVGTTIQLSWDPTARVTNDDGIWSEISGAFNSATQQWRSQENVDHRARDEADGATIRSVEDGAHRAPRGAPAFNTG